MGYKRFVLMLAALAVVVAAGGCSPEDPFVQTKLQPPVGAVAFLRVIHATSDAPPAVVYAGSTPLFGSRSQEYLKYPVGVNEAKYYPVDTAARTISFRGPGGTLASAPAKFAEGKFYTAYLFGAESDLRALVTTDTVAPAPAIATTVLRIVHLASDVAELDVRLGATAETSVPLATGIPYGQATPYVSQEAVFFPGTGIWVFDSKSKREVFGITRNVILPGNSIVTIVMTGRDKPVGDQPIMTFLLFQESRQDQNDGRYGGAPLVLAFAALRLANLMPTQPDPAVPETIDCSLQDSVANDYAANQYFRRNLNKQGIALCAIPPLGLDPAKGTQHIRPSMLLTLLTKSSWPFRIEKNTPQSQFPMPQPVIIPGKPYVWALGKRYTIIAYGPYHTDSARSDVLFDNMPAAPSGRSLVRFFHGAYNLADQKLRLRLGDEVGPPMGYGEVPNSPGTYFQATPGAVSVEVLDADNQVVHQMYVHPNVFESQKAYTIFLSRGAYGTEYTMAPVSQDFDYTR